MLLGHGKEMIRFLWPWPLFQDHYIIKTPEMSLVKSLCALYLFYQCLEFDQTSTDTSSGWGKEVIRFWWSWQFSRSLHYKYSISEPCVHSVLWTNRWNLTKLAQIYYWDWGKKWLDFGDLYFIFKVTPALWNWGRQHSFVEIDHEIFSMVILSLPLIQEGQLSVSGERMCTVMVNRLED